MGHHYIPFAFSEVYNETGRWVLDGGSWRGVVAETFLDILDLVVGEEHALFFKYIVWFVVNGPNIGGIKNLPPTSNSSSDTLYQVGMLKDIQF